MIGYTCKYAPIEVFEALGIDVERIDPNVTSYDKADTMMHANLCSYVKGVLEEVVKKDYEGVILTTCCDSTRRLYDTLKNNFKDKFVYILDLPRKTNDAAAKLYENSILDMISEYEKFKNVKFDKEALKKLLNNKSTEECVKPGSINVGLMGARCNDGIVNLVKKSNGNVLFNISCTGDDRDFNITSDDILYQYAKELLRKLPCVRMEDLSERKEYLDKMKNKVDGIIYHTVKFCDIYSYEYAHIKDQLGIPILKVETDYTKQCEGQIKTRVEAFIESLDALKKEDQEEQLSAEYGNDMHSKECVNCDMTPEKAEEYKKRYDDFKKDVKKEAEESSQSKDVNDGMGNIDDKYVLGIDSGSTSTNAVILKGNKEMVAYHVVRTGAKSSESAHRALKEVLEKAGLNREDISLIVSTGYGRVSIDFADKNVTEISCHGRGAHYLNPEIRTIIDIGGQDSKVIKLNDKGDVIDFVMNDKCAAGTGRFLEMMARTLEIDIKDMGPEALKWKEQIKISSMCSVFAESEVISLIAENKEKCDIIHALSQSIASKTNSLLNRVGKESKFMMTGGVAQNIGVVKALEEKIGEELYISEQPEIVGAIGAALYGIEELVEEK